MLKLRRATVAEVEQADARVIRLVVDAEGERREAIAYPGLTGPVEVGDDIVVNTEARDLGLGSGGFDVVHANLSQLGGGGVDGAHVMKLNYTSLQHAVVPVEEAMPVLSRAMTLVVGVMALHGQLAPAAFAYGSVSSGAALGFVQTAGGALPGQLSDDVAALIERNLLAAHVTASPSFGGQFESITTEGALAAGRHAQGWDAALVGPGPGILGSASTLGHGGLAALTNVHSALAVGCDVVLAPRLSSGDSRARHRGLSHHTATVLQLALRPVTVAWPAEASAESRSQFDEALAEGQAHRVEVVEVAELAGRYVKSGLPTTTMGRSFDDDPDFFLAGLAAGAVMGRVGGHQRQSQAS